MTGRLRPERNLVVGKRLLLTRHALRRKQREFAEQADVSHVSYNQWEKGAVYPPVDGAIKLCKSHKITLDWIYMGQMDCLPTHLSDAIRALMAAEAAQGPDLKVYQPRQRKKSA
jgi:DNA-binding XRE family transcriptional regulator